MLIRWATSKDKPAWIQLADNVADIFGNSSMATDKDFHEYMDSKLSKYEALIAMDRQSESCLGIIGFSRTHNRITWFGVFEENRGRGIGSRLLSTALRQLDNTKDITVETYRSDYPPGLPARAVYQKLGFVQVDNTIFDHLGNPRCKMTIKATDQKRGDSFHYRFPEYVKNSEKAHCLFCNNHPAPDGHFLIAELDHSYAYIEKTAMGRLFGKGYVIAKSHVVDFEEMPHHDMAEFMADVQTVAKALHRFTNAIKINFEIHANSAPHLHCHLFPRYLDDDFPSRSIDVSVTHPSPYESDEEFNWFVDQIRSALR